MRCLNYFKSLYLCYNEMHQNNAAVFKDIIKNLITEGKTMATDTISSTELISITKELFHHTYDGNLDLWFELLCNESVYLGSNSPVLIGADAIRKHFAAWGSDKRTGIVKEHYYCDMYDKRTACVYGIFTLSSNQMPYDAISRFTILYHINDGKPKILHQHNSYEYRRRSKEQAKLMTFTADALAFLDDLMIQQRSYEPLLIKSGKNILPLNPLLILYIETSGKRTNICCVDNIISCNSSISELEGQLPEYFYKIHRSYFVNVKYIVAIRRFEVELLNGTTLSIPEAKYTHVKGVLLERYGKPNELLDET